MLFAEDFFAKVPMLLQLVLSSPSCAPHSFPISRYVFYVNHAFEILAPQRAGRAGPSPWFGTGRAENVSSFSSLFESQPFVRIDARHRDVIVLRRIQFTVL
jgi:hypothetical protein